jgi:hypothetical protein
MSLKRMLDRGAVTRSRVELGIDGLDQKRSTIICPDQTGKHFRSMDELIADDLFRALDDIAWIEQFETELPSTPPPETRHD